MLLRIIVAKILFILTQTTGAEVESYFDFPEGFKFGAASSSYQIEGGWNASDKGPSIWDEYTHANKNLIKDQSNADVACDSYHKYKEDVKILKDIGFDHYRFSLSWPRILPTGFGNKVSKDGIQYYKNLIDELHANGIEPFVTLYHWDEPAVMGKMGTWLNELMVDYFGDYARIVFRELGPKVKHWVTINEPHSICTKAFGDGEFAPGMQMPNFGPYICGHNILKAHARAYRIYDEEFRATQHGKIAIDNSCFNMIPADPNDSESAEIAFQFSCGWFTNPIYSENGDYPKIMRERIDENSKLQGFPRSRLPSFSTYWVNYIKGTYDFFGFNHYSTRVTESVERTADNPEWFEDSGVRVSNNHRNWSVGASDWLNVVPHGFGDILRKIKTDYNNPEIYILENGYSSKGEMLDFDRIIYLYSYLKEMFLAINRDGCNIKVYTLWSILDNFEWARGYTERFGIVHVDFTDPNRTRTPRLSATWVNSILRSRKLISSG